MVQRVDRLPETIEDYKAALALADRRFARAEKAREAAEHFLEVRGRILAKVNAELKKRESDLLEQAKQDAQKLLLAQELAAVATVHVSATRELIGSRNLATVLGLKGPVTDLGQLLSMIHPLEGATARAYLEGRINGPSETSRDIRFLDQSGKTRWLRWTIQSGLQDRGSYHGAVRDITRERHAERKVRTSDALRARQLRKLERVSNELRARVADLDQLSSSLEISRNQAIRADQAKSRFLAMMSHDIRTPMNAILATLDLIAESDLNPEQDRLIELARTSGEQMLFLLADILEVARSDGWTFDLEEGRVCLSDYLHTIVDAWRPLADRHGLSLALGLETGLPQCIRTDGARLRQLLDNLISNAIKYTPSGSVRVHARLAVLNHAQALRITVSDTGPGIPPQQRERLFEDGQRLIRDPLESGPQGTGLGLGICKRIAKAMDAEIGLDSVVGQGSSFWVTLPCREWRQNEAADAPTRPSPDRPILVDGRPPHVLVAEDVETNRIVMAALLDRLPCTFKMAEDGQGAVELAEVERFDAILMDVSMPVMDGMEATRRIRARGGLNATIPIIAVTAFAAEEEKAAFLEVGMDQVLSKPVRLANMRRVLEVALAGRAGEAVRPHEGIIPAFRSRSSIDESALRQQLMSVPESAREKLTATIQADLETWLNRFIDAMEAGETDAVATAHHALKGICAGFGATALAEDLATAREEFAAGKAPYREHLSGLLERTCTDICAACACLDRRQAA
jgi:signal transduction histidine kinase